ncbi:MAG: hypothetical protein V4617_11605 [Gemmatimonadota bacterium]
MRKHAPRYIALVGGIVGSLGGCVGGDGLTIVNDNNPDVDRAYSSAAGVEAIIAGLGIQIFNPSRASESVNTQAKILSGEGYATVANFGMAVRAAIPRGSISNELGNDNQVGNLANFNTFSRTSRSASNAIAALNLLNTNGQSTSTAITDARARAFGYLMLGQSLGNLALAYDSAAIISPLTKADSLPPLSSAKDVMAAAISAIDSAVNIANSPVAVGGGAAFTLPSTWINGPSVDRATFIRIARSYRARYRAGVARNVAERAAVDWTKVIDDATNGITADYTVTLSAGIWTATYDVSQSYVSTGWHSMPYFYYGMADVSGGYDAWLATPRDQRVAFLVVTPDKRWPSGTTRAAQQADAPTVILPAGRYFRNRATSEDVPIVGPGDSFYDVRRYGGINRNSLNGPYVEISKGEIDMLAAEGHLRAGNFAAAATLINVSRERNGLAPISGITSLTQPISTNLATCVPRVPKAPEFTTTECGNIFEAMKYEKRMESTFTGYMVWFADNRGWGDLIEGTAVEWPVPYQEMQARTTSYYNGTKRAPRGTYGF